MMALLTTVPDRATSAIALRSVTEEPKTSRLTMTPIRQNGTLTMMMNGCLNLSNWMTMTM